MAGQADSIWMDFLPEVERHPMHETIGRSCRGESHLGQNEELQTRSGLSNLSGFDSSVLRTGDFTSNSCAVGGRLSIVASL